MKKILMLSVLTPITDKSSRVLKQAQSMQNSGYDVLVLSQNDSIQLMNETIQGVSVQRIRLFSKCFHSNIVTHIIRFFELYFKVKKIALDFDIIDCHDLFSLLIGYWISKKTHAKLIFDAHELESERTGLKGMHKKISKFLEKKLIYKCTHVITVSKSINDWYENQYSIDNVSCIYNAPRYTDGFDQHNNYFRQHFNIPTDTIVFLYQGALASARGLDLLVDCFKMLPSKYVVIFMGYGPLSQYIQTEANYADNIFYHEAVPMSKLKDTTSSADYGMSLIAPASLNEEYCMPNKLFEYIMYGIPVIGFNTKDQAEFIKKHDIGYVLEKYDVVSLKELILSLDPKKHSIFKENVQKIRKDISWETMEKRLLNIYANC